MPTIAQFRATSPLGGAGVDAAGIFRGVKIISEGEAEGHCLFVDPKTGKKEGEWREGLVAVPLFVDSVTCEQVLSCASKFGEQGLPIKFNPDTFNHGDGSLVGAARNFRIEGKSVVADAHLLTSYEHKDYLVELAATMPGNFGLSIDFMISQEERGGVAFARCEKLLAVTVVDRPAANVGLFRVGDKKEFDAVSENNQPAASNQSAMTPDEIKALIMSLLEPLMAKIDSLSAATSEPDGDEMSPEEMAACQPEDKEKVEGMSAKQRAAYFASRLKPAAPVALSAADVAAAATLAATKAVEEFAARTTGRQPAPANPQKSGSAGKTGFSAKVEELTAAGIKGAFAVAVRQFPELYNEHVASADKKLFRART